MTRVAALPVLRSVVSMLGAWRGSTGAYYTSEGWIPNSWPWNYWQQGRDPIPAGECAAVEAAVSAYAQTVAMCPPTHWRTQTNGGRKALTDTPLARALRRPNDYQTRSDFLNNQVRALYFRGNCYALAPRTNGQIAELHPLHPDTCKPYVDPESGDVYYSVAPYDVTPRQDGVPVDWPLDMARMVPERYVWHVRINTPKHPLVGVSCLTAAAYAISANSSISAQQDRFFANMSRPSGTLNTDAILKPDQVKELRERWQEQSQGLAVGGVPILTAGLKWTPLSMSAADAQLVEYYKLSIADIARVMRIPLPLVGVMEQATYNNTEVLMNFWVASGLGFLLEHIELSLDKFFSLPLGEYVELDTKALLRSNFKERIEGLVRGVQGGVYAPNEARREEGLPAADGGDMPRVQQQLVPLDYEPPAPAPAPALPAPANDEPASADEGNPEDDAARNRAAVVDFADGVRAVLQRRAS